MRPYVAGQVALYLSSLCFTVSSFFVFVLGFLRFFLSVSSPCLLFSVHGFKASFSHDCSIPLLPLSNHLLLLTQSSLSLHLHQWLIGSGHLSSHQLRQLFLVDLVLWLCQEMTRPPPQRSNWTSNPYTSLLNPLSNAVLSSSAFSAVRSGAPRSNIISSFHAVDLPDRQHVIRSNFLSPLPATCRVLNGIVRFQ